MTIEEIAREAADHVAHLGATGYEQKFELIREAIQSAIAPLQADARLFGEIMALMNGDGGHYQSEHGSQKAFDRAVERWEERYRRMDNAEYALAQAQTPSAPLLRMVQRFYVKHHMNIDEEGWTKLGDDAGNLLAEVMGDLNYQEWLQKKELEHE